MTEKPVFEAILSPHRSLGRTGLIILVSLTAGLTVFHAIMFATVRAWPVVGFFFIDLLLLYGAFWLSYRSGRQREFVSVSRTSLAIRKVAPSGKDSAFECNPFWARFNVDRHEEIGITKMRVVERNRHTDIGAFLNPDDKESFASAFSNALATVKRG